MIAIHLQLVFLTKNSSKEQVLVQSLSGYLNLHCQGPSAQSRDNTGFIKEKLKRLTPIPLIEWLVTLNTPSLCRN